MNHSTLYRFDDFTLDVGMHQLRRGTDAIEVSKLSFRLLQVLVEHAPNVVTHDTLAASIWGPRRIVTPENLAKRVMLLRRALGDRARNPRYIAGVRGVGYRLVSTVRAPEEAAAPNGEAVAGRSGEQAPRLGQVLRYFAVASIAALAAVAMAGLLVAGREAGGDEPIPPAAEAPAESERPAATNSVRISVEFLDADTENLIWSDIYEGELEADELRGIQSEIAKSIAASLGGEAKGSAPM